MAEYVANRVEKPWYFKIAPLTSSRPKRPPYVIGFDSEAESGKPFLFQFGHPDETVDLLYPGNKRYEALRMFFAYVKDRCRGKQWEYIIYGFNLQYEWTQLFAHLSDSTKQAGEFYVNIEFRDGEIAHVRALNEKRYTLTIEFGRLDDNDVFHRTNGRAIRFVDAHAFITTSLDQASKIIGIGRKLAKPKHFQKKYARTPDFIAYAKQDAILTQKLGEYITRLHETYDVTQCISAPHFASKVFRRRFLTGTVALPDEELEQYGLSSYHGGKNGFYLTQPELLKGIWHYDIRSAYPEAMRQLPNIQDATWSRADSYTPGKHAIWKATVSYTTCTYRAFQTIAGQWINESGITTVFVTGYELDTAVELGEVNVLAADGWIMEGEPGGPLVEYVDTFYQLKRDAPTPAERATAKLFLNSLYGKFFQKVPANEKVETARMSFDDNMDYDPVYTTDPNVAYDWKAGGLYHPPIASLITGYVRAKIHRLEHKYQSVMTSTDGFFGRVSPDETELGNELGQLSAEIGTLRIWRERTYIFTPDNGDPETFAMHGFQGTREQLKRMPVSPGYVFRYFADHMVTLRESVTIYRGKSPGEFIRIRRAVTLPGIPNAPPTPP